MSHTSSISFKRSEQKSTTFKAEKGNFRGNKTFKWEKSKMFHRLTNDIHQISHSILWIVLRQPPQLIQLIVDCVQEIFKSINRSHISTMQKLFLDFSLR